MPLIKTGVSMSPDMKFGWRPKDDISGAPIPLYYEFEQFSVPVNPHTNEEYEPLYLGPRFRHSLALHKEFANISLGGGPLCLQHSYQFKFPPNMSVIEQIIKNTHRQEPPRPFVGMNPAGGSGELVFDANFESGNLDMVIKVRELEYDLYMRVDTNTRGHHQWFFFSVEHKEEFWNKTVTFRIVNFTKSHSLYTQGMRVCVASKA